MRIGLLKEVKIPSDNRVALSPSQSAAIMRAWPKVQILAESSDVRCYSDQEYSAAGIAVVKDLSSCDILLGIKEVKPDHLTPNKTYLFFSHTKKKQPYNQGLMKALIKQDIRMIDYECLTHADGQRILGFGFFAGVVGAHNGLLAYGERTGKYHLPAAHQLGSLAAVKEAYNNLVLPPLKIVLTGSGKVASGIVEVMTLLAIDYVEPEDFLKHQYEYPVYTHLSGSNLYARKDDGSYARNDFHTNPSEYKSMFAPFLSAAHILMNGIYWDEHIPRLFEAMDLLSPDFMMYTMADITCDPFGSVPINIGASTIADPVYGVNRNTKEKCPAYNNDADCIDVMAVDNLPNELPRDASEHFGLYLEKYVLRALFEEGNDVVKRATICEAGKLTQDYEYLSDYAY